MAVDRLHLSLVTPERAIVDEDVDTVQVPGLEGYLGILPGHAPLFSELGIGELSYVAGGRTHSLFVSNGFVEVLDNQVRILADAAERAADIDLDRARAARARAEERISRGGHDLDYTRVQAALERARLRIQVAGKRGRPAA